MCCQKELQDSWLAYNQPKKLITILFPETPILHILEDCFPTGYGPECTSGRTLYQRRFIEQVRGKPCSMCGELLNGSNTYVIYYIFPRKYKEEVYCKCCNNISAKDKKIIRKNGYDVFKEVNSLNSEIRMYNLHLKSLRDYKKDFTNELNGLNSWEIYQCSNKVLELKNQIDILKIRIDNTNNTLVNLKNKKKTLLGIKTPKPVPVYEIDYNEIVPFRSEEDFDF